MSRLEKGLGKLLERRQPLHVGYLPLQTRRRAEMEQVKFEVLRTGSMGTVRSCSRGLYPAQGILASLRGTRVPVVAATLPSLTRTNTHAIKPADFQSVLLVQVTCPGLLIQITTLPSQNQPAQRSINKHQQEPRQNHRVNQSPTPLRPCSRWCVRVSGRAVPPGPADPRGSTLTKPADSERPRRIHSSQTHAKRSSHAEACHRERSKQAGRRGERRGMDERRSDCIMQTQCCHDTATPSKNAPYKAGGEMHRAGEASQ